LSPQLGQRRSRLNSCKKNTQSPCWQAGAANPWKVCPLQRRKWRENAATCH
jgi:hypothetical protein